MSTKGKGSPAKYRSGMAVKQSEDIDAPETKSTPRKALAKKKTESPPPSPSSKKRKRDEEEKETDKSKELKSSKDKQKPTPMEIDEEKKKTPSTPTKRGDTKKNTKSNKKNDSEEGEAEKKKEVPSTPKKGATKKKKDETESDSEDNSKKATPVKRGRGRPKKTPTKQKKESESESESEEESKKSTPVKRGRGRPKKTPTKQKKDSSSESEEEKKTPKRKLPKRKSTLKKKTKTSSSDSELDSESESDVPKKRGRGRPRKTPVKKKKVVSSSSESDSGDDYPKRTPKRKGKAPRRSTTPMKRKTPARNNKRKRQDSDDEAGSSTPTKRGPGRPRGTPVKKSANTSVTEGSASRPNKRRKIFLEDENGEPYWDVWTQIYLVGTEWENYDSVFDIQWDFSHLREALEEGGELYELGKKHPVYLFGSTEPQLMTVEEDKPSKVVPLPHVVAVISEFPPPPTLGLNSVQKEVEEIIPMRELKMSWVPYRPKSAWRVDPKKYVPFAYFLECSQRRSSLRNLKEEQSRRFEYALPYIFLPRALPPIQVDTEVNCFCTIEGKGIAFQYDWELDEMDEIVPQVIQTNELDEKYKTEIEETITNAIKDARANIRKEREDRKLNLEKHIPDDARRKALDELQTYKFYPKNTMPDITQLKSPYVNRYYGKANKVF